MRKPILLTLVFFVFDQSLIAQNNLLPSTGNVGINLPNGSPAQAPLHVIGEGRFNNYGWFGWNINGALTEVLRLGENNAWETPVVTVSTADINGWNYGYWTSSRAGHSFVIKRQSSAGEKWITQIGGGDGGHNITLYSATDGATGKVQLNSEGASYFTEPVGIGTSFPSNGAKLNVHTTQDNHGIFLTHSAGGVIRFLSNSLTALAFNGIVKQSDAGIIFGDHTGQDNVNFGFVLAPWRGGTSGLRVDKSGSVSIATSTVDPNSKLLVEGAIRARKVKVDNDSWPDYVFEQRYQLPSLAEVSSFIQEHKHLPGIPSAREVKENGIDLGNNQAALLQKIEELTLYIIDQQKQIDELKKKNELINDLAKELEILKKAVTNKD